MTSRANPLFPSIIFPLDGLVEHIDEVQLRPGVVLRNLDASERLTINQMIQEHDGRFWGVSPLPPDIVCTEAHWERESSGEERDDYERYLDDVRQASSVAERVTSLLRLAHGGPIGTRIGIVPLAETIPSAYTITQVGYLPPIFRPPRPRKYELIPATLAEAQSLFRDFWNTDPRSVPGLRWFNKAYAEMNPDDALAHVVFGLEHLLLGESDRSNLSFKLALRGAWLLGAEASSRETIFDCLRKGYALRSQIAHGRLTRLLSEEEIRLSGELEEILRQLVLRYLRHREQFEETALKKLTLGFAIGESESS